MNLRTGRWGVGGPSESPAASHPTLQLPWAWCLWAAGKGSTVTILNVDFF